MVAEARFGMFMHWGVYSRAGRGLEGAPVRGYAEHIQRIRKIPIAGLPREGRGHFNPTGFDADAWVRAAASAGMGYLIITAKHHDGFAMYDSQVSDYNVVKATPWKRDPMRALKDACARQGLKFGFYYSHAFDWGERDGAGQRLGLRQPRGRPPLCGGERWWSSTPSGWPRCGATSTARPSPSCASSSPSTTRTSSGSIPRTSCRPREPAHPAGRARGQARLVINGRVGPDRARGPPARFGDYRSTADKPAEFPPATATGRGSPPPTSRTAGTAGSLAQAARALHPPAGQGGRPRRATCCSTSGPMGDGRIDPEGPGHPGRDRGLDEGNGESIRGTTTLALPVQAWGESTRKGSPSTCTSSPGRAAGGSPSAVCSRRSSAPGCWPTDGRSSSSAPAPRTWWCTSPPRRPTPSTRWWRWSSRATSRVDPARLLSTDVPADTLRAFDGERVGPGLSFGAGKTRDAWVRGWSRPEAAMAWPVRLEAPATYQVAIAYDADQPSVGGRYRVRLGNEILEGTVERTPRAPVPLGKVHLPPGAFDIRVEAVRIAGDELMRCAASSSRPSRD
jgi:hypothetical protein